MAQTDPTAPCVHHRQVAATHHCVLCARMYCADCTRRDLGRGVTAHICPTCGGQGQVRVLPPPGRAVDFAESLRGVWRFPLAGRGAYVLGAGVLLWALIGLAIQFGGLLAMGAAMMVLVFGAAYLATFLLSVAAETADGADVLPDWPDPGQVYLNLGRNLFAMLVLLTVTVLPTAISLRLEGLQGAGRAVALFATSAAARPDFVDTLDGSRGLWLTLGVLAVVQLYMPMSLLLLALGGRIRDLSPLIVVPAIVRTGPAYLVAAVMLLLVLVLQVSAALVAGALPLVGGLASDFVSLWLLVVAMRVLGLLYRTHGHRMGLFDSSADDRDG